MGLVALLPPLLRADKPDVRARLLVPSKAPPGSHRTVVVELTIGSGWHVNSHTPAEKFLIPTDVTLTATSGQLSPVRYPADVQIRPSFADKPMRVYEGTVRFDADLELPGEIGDAIAIRGVVAYQACNDHQCFPPAKIPIEGSITIESGR